MPSFNKILDTFLFSGNEIHLEKFHIDRVFETYQFLQTKTTRDEVESIYSGIKKQLREEKEENILVRVVLDPVRPHKHTVEVKTLDPVSQPLRLILTEALQPVSQMTQFKFADRKEWDLLFNSKPDGSDDVLVIREGQLIETSRFNLFLHDPQSNLVFTPSLNSGCLNGVFRRHLLSQGHVELPDSTQVAVREKDLALEDLQGCQLYAGNSVRGLLSASVI